MASAASLIDDRRSVSLVDFKLTPVPLSSLQPGDGFRLYGMLPGEEVVGFVWRVGSCSVSVRVYRNSRQVIDTDGDRTRVFESRESSDSAWSLNSLVLREPREDVIMPENEAAPGNLVPGEKKKAAPAKGKPAKKEAKVKKEKTVNECGCGCGGTTFATFVPGHDARYFGWLKKLVSGDIKPGEVTFKDGTKAKVFNKRVPDVKTAKALLAESKH